MSFPKHQSYKDSGVEWLGQVPTHWMVMPPKHMMRSCSGGTSIKGDCADEPEEGLYQGFSASGPDVWLTGFDFDCPGLVLSAVGARCGKTFKADGRWGVVANTHCLLPKPGANRDYLWYLTNNEAWWEKGGTAQPFVKVAETLARPFVFPPLTEQSAIAAFLDRETAKLDDLVQEQQRLIELLKEKRQAFISHAVTKGLNPDAPMKGSGVEWLGEVPEHWVITKVGRHVDIVSGFAFPSNEFSLDESHTRLLRGINVGIQEIRWDETVYWERKPDDRLERFLLSSGDLIIGMDRPWIGGGTRVAILGNEDAPCLLLQRVAALRPDDRLNKKFLFFLLQSAEFAAYLTPDMTGVSVPHISPEQIGGFKVALPAITEQTSLVAFIEQEFRAVNALIAASDASISLLQERRSALISAAVTGKIDVRGLVSLEAEAA